MYRLSQQQDIPQIISLWQTVFGETPILPPGLCFVAELEGRIVSMLHALPQTLLADRAHKAYYLYAIGTDPNYRGQGICRQLMAFAERALDADCLVLVPAQESLFGFYETMGYKTAFTRHKTAFCGGEEISMAQYLHLREALLQSVPHMVYEDLSYAQRIYGLKFYKTASGICAASEHFTAECLPEDLGSVPCGMIKWLSNEVPLQSAYLGFTLE
ncbi:MAG: GNAT family N-acetyltransferase [Oscillospiraceae bacterium]|nr:GNAT family N-acetyltransferase [Oscillospiraceae bacterium]